MDSMNRDKQRPLPPQEKNIGLSPELARTIYDNAESVLFSCAKDDADDFFDGTTIPIDDLNEVYDLLDKQTTRSYPPNSYVMDASLTRYPGDAIVGSIDFGYPPTGGTLATLTDRYDFMLLPHDGQILAATIHQQHEGEKSSHLMTPAESTALQGLISIVEKQ